MACDMMTVALRTEASSSRIRDLCTGRAFQNCVSLPGLTGADSLSLGVGRCMQLHQAIQQFPLAIRHPAGPATA